MRASLPECLDTVSVESLRANIANRPAQRTSFSLLKTSMVNLSIFDYSKSDLAIGTSYRSLELVSHPIGSWDFVSRQLGPTQP